MLYWTHGGWTEPMKYTEIVETLGSFIDIAGALMIVVGLLIATMRYIVAFRTVPESYKGYGPDIGRAIYLGWRCWSQRILFVLLP
jgi:hypothetical protein